MLPMTNTTVKRVFFTINIIKFDMKLFGIGGWFCV